MEVVILTEGYVGDTCTSLHHQAGRLPRVTGAVDVHATIPCVTALIRPDLQGLDWGRHDLEIHRRKKKASFKA